MNYLVNLKWLLKLNMLYLSLNIEKVKAISQKREYETEGLNKKRHITLDIMHTIGLKFACEFI